MRAQKRHLCCHTHVDTSVSWSQDTCASLGCVLSYTRRYVSFAELDHVYQFGLRQPMNLCSYVSKEGGDGEGTGSEEPSLLSYTVRYVSLGGSKCNVPTCVCHGFYYD